jgi:hypothetical protein
MIISKSEYRWSHDKEPRGDGWWMFESTKIVYQLGIPVRVKSVFNAPYGNFTQAKKAAIKWARENGFSLLNVLP